MSEAKLHEPHDRLVKWVLSRPMAAAVELRHVLPSSLSTHIDWSTLSVLSGDHLDPSLGSRVGDLLVSVELCGPPPAAMLVFPVEHQSSEDNDMAWRMLEHSHGVWTGHRRDGGVTKRPMPIVIPIVLAQVARPWRAPRQLTELLAVPDAVLRAIPSPIELRYLVDELDGTVLDDPIASDGVLALVESMRILLRWARRPWEVTEERIAWLAQLLDCVMDELGRDDLRALWAYVINVFPSDSLLRQPLIDASRPPMQQEFFSIYDEAVALGRTEGLALGRTEGLALGRTEGLALGRTEGDRVGRLAMQVELLLRVLERRGLAPTRAHRRRIRACTDDGLLRRWFDRALTAGSVREVLGR